MEKSTINFLAEDGTGFEIVLEQRKEEGKTPFLATVTVVGTGEKGSKEEIPMAEGIHLEIAMDNISKMMMGTDTFELVFTNFEMQVLGHEEYDELAKGVPGRFMMGQGGEA